MQIEGCRPEKKLLKESNERDNDNTICRRQETNPENQVHANEGNLKFNLHYCREKLTSVPLWILNNPNSTLFNSGWLIVRTGTAQM